MTDQEIRERISKLPRALRFYVEKLEADNRHMRQKLAEINGESETNTFIEAFQRDDNPRLPKFTTINFVPLGKDRLSHGISVRATEGGGIQIVGNSSIIVLPGASNTVEIKTTGR